MTPESPRGSASTLGKLYLAGLALSVLTSFGLSSTGKFNAGHALGILTLLAAFGGTLIRRLSFLGPLRPYMSAMGLSFSFFLLLVPGINETLSRLPPWQPSHRGRGGTFANPTFPLLDAALRRVPGRTRSAAPA